MAQKVITVILALVVLGGLAWYFNRTYLQPSAGHSREEVPQLETSSSLDGVFQGQLVFVTQENNKEIWATDIQKNTKKLFTDADETEKLIKISNLAPLSKEVLAVISTDSSSFSGKLAAINLETAKASILQTSFGVPAAWNISSDGQKITLTKFSNLEDNYGYTLYSEDRDGANLRELVRNDSVIKSPTWNKESTKIAYTISVETKSQINIVDASTAETKEVKSFENQVIDWLSWSNDKLVFCVRNLSSANQGAIEIIDLSGENLKKITDFDGGMANFAYFENSAYLGYLVAQYQDQINDSTTGQIYILNPKNEEIPIQKGSQILGWLPGG